MKHNILANAHKAFREGDYATALSGYYEFKRVYPELAELIEINISLIEKNYYQLLPQKEKIIVYTCNFGGYESIKEPLFVDERVEYILFTDNENITSKIWKIEVIKERLSDPRRTSRLAKILPHKYLPPHDISVYIDSSLELKTGDVCKMVEECLEDKDIALYKHYKRNCVYDEIHHVMRDPKRKADKNLCERAIKTYRDISYPNQNGLFENAFIIRKNTPEIRQLNSKWWSEYINGTERDQFVFMYCIYQLKIQVNSIKVGTQFRNNPYVNHIRHEYVNYSASDEHTINWIVGGESSAGWAYENNTRRFIEYMPEYKHAIDAKGKRDVALYFDVLLHDRMPVPASESIVRIGGPRPIDRLCGDDKEKLRRVLSNFHSVICLNNELTKNLSLVHPNVHMIPNGLDLDKFNPNKKIKRNSRISIIKRLFGDYRAFTIGFAGSVKSSAERETKGLDYVIEAAKLARVSLLNVGRGKGQVQIPHKEMIEKFYSQIDVLIHPVGPGREGSSNVIMEALALGIPVITTKYAGYHSECLTDSVNVLFCARDAEDIAEKIRCLVKDKALYEKLSREGRKFAELHHNIFDISAKYKQLIDNALVYSRAKQKISFVPFWLPVQDFATGRLRCAYAANIIGSNSDCATRLGYDPKADVVFISQLASDTVYQQILDNKHQFVIYDICDRYYSDTRVVGGVVANKRFNELAERANLIVSSTVELKRDLYNLNIRKPIVHIPDGIDFKEFPSIRRTEAGVKTVGWFGNPGRGNFESAAWILETALRSGKKVKLITKRKSLKKYPLLYPYAKEWCYSTFIEELQECDIAVVTHAQDEQNKSPNRLITAVSKGIPVIVSSSSSCEEILREADLDWAIVHNEQEFNTACEFLADPIIKNKYFEQITLVIEGKYGDTAIRSYYLKILREHVAKPTEYTKRVLFVSHNLNIGEGAPTSLYQTIIGLKQNFNIEPVVFCPMTGQFKTLYEQQGIPVINYTNKISKDSLKPLNSNFEKTKSDFHKLLEEGKFDLVICNTAKMLPYVAFSAERGIPAISIIRESSDDHVNITFSEHPKIIESAKMGLDKAQSVIFVSDLTRQLWMNKQPLLNTQVIHNGIITESWNHLKNITKKEAREKLTLPLNRKIILSVGTINARKAQIDIVNAYKILPDDLIKKSYLVLVGARDSSYLTSFKKDLESLPKSIQESILLVPETDNVGDWYKAADIFAFASHNESYPRVIIEALYFGLEIISSKVFGVAEQLGNNSKASTYEIGDVNALAKALELQLSREISESNNKYFYSLTTYHEMLNKYFVQISKVTQ